ncbi:MAG: protein kinase [Gammaproteobacteria bacterium]|jgi:serine/threonine-protein kinase
MTLTVGTQLGSFEIIGTLGAGGMGEVYRATDTKLGREVAIKTLPASLADDADRLARFEREAKLLATLNHAHIAAVHSLDETAGTLYIVMELIEGESLEARLKSGPIPVDDALQFGLQIASALEAAHEKGVVHRDLKPANIMITPEGVIKVLDFGLAKAFAGKPTEASPAHSPALSAAMTQQGLVLGTAGYMSPEQASGQATDQRADVWAFGVVMYEMLTGQAVFSGESVPHILADVLKTTPNWKRLPPLHPRLKLMLERCLRKKPRERYHSIADVRLEIEDVLREPEVRTDAVAQTVPLWRRALPAAATLVLGVALASAYFVSQAPPPAPAVAAERRAVSRFEIVPPAEAPLARLGGAQVAISPDGQQIAYFATRPETGNVELYVRDLNSLEARPVPGSEGRSVENANLFFAPDGKAVGYLAPERGGIIAVALDGRPTVRMFDTQSAYLGATWSDDNTVIYASGNQLFRVSAGGGGTPAALTPAGRPGGIAGPTLLPGGRAVLFHGIDPSGNDLVGVVDLETGEEKTLVEGGANPFYSDTGHIVFARGTTLMAVPFRQAELAVAGEPVALIQGVRRTPGGASHFALSASGTLVYEPSSDDAASEALSAVVWVDRQGEIIERAVADLVTNPRDPHLSPDGSRLLLVTGQINSGDLWSYDLTGRPPIPLALPGDVRFPVWSPDSRRVAFVVIQGTPEIFTLPADGSVLAPISLRGPGPIGVPHVWAADELILTTNPSSPDIIAITATASGDVRPVVASVENSEFDPALSPNGRWLAYVSDRTGDNEIWVQAYPDGVPIRVSNNGGYEPLWSRDGHELFYWQGTTMMALAVEPEDAFSFGTATPLFSGSYFTFPGAGGRTWDVGPDGRFLMIVAGDETSAGELGKIVVVQNFAQELQDRVGSGRE